MLKLGGVTAALFVGLASASAQAATVEQMFEVRAAPSFHAGRDMSLWINGGFATDLRGTFAFHDAGMMRMFSDGTARIEGRVLADDDHASGFDLEFSYDSVMGWTPVFKHQFGSVEHGNESYMDMERGVLRGFGRLEGLDLTLTRMPVAGPYATQMGGGLGPEIGANNHNANYGLANWFFVESILSRDCAICADNAWLDALVGQNGDMNVDLIPLSPVPLPGAGWLLLAGLGTAMLYRRESRV